MFRPLLILSLLTVFLGLIFWLFNLLLILWLLAVHLWLIILLLRLRLRLFSAFLFLLSVVIDLGILSVSFLELVLFADFVFTNILVLLDFLLRIWILSLLLLISSLVVACFPGRC
jgi:hypothetical protein